MTHFIDLAKYAPILKLRLNALFAKKKKERLMEKICLSFRQQV
jgi:hypothetical protein